MLTPLLASAAALLSAQTVDAPANAHQDYMAEGKAALAAHLAQSPNTSQAKNVILFVGDGMSIATMTASRIFDGQQRGVDGESNRLSFGKFPYTALSRTYSDDYQVADSAATATAMMTGAKTRSGMISVRRDAQSADCSPNSPQALETIAEIAEESGKATGVVTTARLTHATPATMYAHTSRRGWESDDDVPDDLRNSCPDIARQLIEWPYGDGLEVAMGGGRAGFIPEDVADAEYDGEFGNRADGRDLTAEWVEKYGDSGVYVWNQAQFDAIDPASEPHILGLFQPSHMHFEADRAGDEAGEPSLAEMTTKAIQVLSQNENGFFLLVEGGRMDHANHAGNAYRAVSDTVAMSEAVDAAMKAADPQETLIVVTADHSHTMTIPGYPSRGNPILGLAATADGPILAKDGKPYTTIGYANGPGAQTGERKDLSDVDVEDRDFVQQSLVPTGSETHNGEDVAIFSQGPWAHLLTGSVEQNYIFHVMRYAMSHEGAPENPSDSR